MDINQLAPNNTWLIAAKEKESELLSLGVPKGRILDSLKDAARWGLLPDGHEYAIYSFRKRNGEMTCLGFPMIGGLRKISLSSGKVSILNSNAIYPGQKWEYREGSDRVFVHHVSSSDRKGNPTHVYAFVKFVGGDWDVELWSWDEVEKFKETIGRKEEWGSVWEKFPVAMAKAKVTKKLLSRYVIVPEDEEDGQTISQDTGVEEKPSERKPAVVSSEVSGLLD